MLRAHAYASLGHLPTSRPARTTPRGRGRGCPASRRNGELGAGRTGRQKGATGAVVDTSVACTLPVSGMQPRRCTRLADVKGLSSRFWSGFCSCLVRRGTTCADPDPYGSAVRGRRTPFEATPTPGSLWPAPEPRRGPKVLVATEMFAFRVVVSGQQLDNRHPGRGSPTGRPTIARTRKWRCTCRGTPMAVHLLHGIQQNLECHPLIWRRRHVTLGSVDR